MTKISKKVLLGCYEVPGYGGASTASYKLFEMMQEYGLDVSYINIIHGNDEEYFRYLFGETYGNPKGLHDVYNYVLDNSLKGKNSKLTRLINKLAPDIMLGIGFLAAFFLKSAAPSKPLIFLTSGCRQVKELINANKAKDAITLTEFINRTNYSPTIFSQLERKAVGISDLIITHSDLIRNFVNYFYYNYVEKIYSDIIWFGEWIYQDALDYSAVKKSYSQREIDVIFAVNSWIRPEKNFNLLKKVVPKLKGLNIHIVGETKEQLPNAELHGLVSNREDLFTLLGNSKTLVCVSRFDPAPGILYEASALNCNIVASKNCGNWRICNKHLLVDPYHLNNFVEKIYISLKKKFDDNIDYFLASKSFNHMIDILSVY